VSLIFFGTPSFAVPSLNALIGSGEDIALVVTQPDRVKGRGHMLSAPPVKELALSKHIPVAQPAGIRGDDFLRELAGLKPEFIIVVAYGRMLPEGILNLPECGCINIHGSLLPKYRGAAPIQWALLKGERVTGVTTMLIDMGLDTGDILLRKEMEIRDDDNTETLFNRLSELGALALVETLAGLRSGTVRPGPQTGEPSYAPPLKKEDGRIDWHRPSEELFNFIRGMYPWPGAFCFYDGQRIKITRARSAEGAGVPGKIEMHGGDLAVGTGRGLLFIDELQPEGRKAMPGRAFIAGRRIGGKDEKFS
jgi:methionyl-tRNA formyltransferase